MPDYVLALGLVVCLITDLKARKIYNIVLLPLIIFGLVFNVLTSEWTGLLQALLGMLTGLGILLIPFVMGGIGAGDVKLLAAIGAVKGPYFVLCSALCMGVAGGIIAVLVLLSRGRFIAMLKSLLSGLWLMLITRFKVIEFDFDNEKMMLPYGLAIVIGAVSAYWWMR